MSSPKPFQSNFRECDVCCLYADKYIACIYCKAEACDKCHQTFILDQFQDKCMFCNKSWNYEFMQTNFKESWLEKTYKDKKKTLLFEKEKALLPTTQQEMKIDEEKEEMRKKFNRLVDRLKTHNDQLKKLYSKSKYDLDEANALEAAMEKLRHKIDLLQVKNTELTPVTIEARPTYPCSKGGCRGFLEKDFSCGMCETQHCKKCRDVKLNDEHKCDPNTLETIKLMEKDTKPCPKCAVPIFKIEGCDQIWCVQCHTAFSWKTGKIDNGPIHNPHYWQYLREEGKDQEELNRLYGDQPNVRIIDNPCLNLDNVMMVAQAKAFEVCRLLVNIREYDLPKYTRPVDNKDIRVRYLKNDLDEKNFKITLYRREKKQLYNTEVSQILSMIHDASKDVLVEVFRETWTSRSMAKNRKNFEKLYKEKRTDLLKICTYASKEVKSLTERYGYSTTSQAVHSKIQELIHYLE